MWRRLSGIVGLFVVLLLIHGVAVAPGVVGRAEAQVKGQQSLQQLIDGAKKEGSLRIAGVAGSGRAGAVAIGEAFNKRFGLNIKVDYNTEGSAPAEFGRAISEVKQGLPTSFDVLNGPIDYTLRLCQVGCASVDNWQKLLPKGVDPANASPSPMDGKVFLFSTREPAIIYNTNLITEAELPKTTRDLVDPKYKGKFYTAPWTDFVSHGLVVYPKDEWLKTLQGWGENKATTMVSGQGVPRMMLGEFAFEPFSNSYYYFREKANNNPVGLAFFHDVVPISLVIHIMPKTARHPNAAALFMLWATGPEFNAIFEKHSGTGNIYLESSEIGKGSMAAIKKAGARTVRWTESAQSWEVLKWLASQEGIAYNRQMAKALKVQ